jgi:ribosomal protein S3
VLPFEVDFRKRVVRGGLRLPNLTGPHPVVVLFNGTNGVKVWIFKGEILEHDPMAQDKRMAETPDSGQRPRRDRDGAN